jgi:type I restriction enzyme S subunit
VKSKYTKYKLSDIGGVYSGATPSTKIESYYKNGTIPWITPKDLSNNNELKYISKGSRNITIEGYNSTSTMMLPIGTVLFSSRAPIGYVAIAKNELCTNQGFKSVVCNSQYVYNEYLYYYFIAKKSEIESFANGSTFKELSLSAMKDIIIELPELDEQHKVASILNSIDNKIDYSREIIHNMYQIAYLIYKKWFRNLEYQNDLYSTTIGESISIIGGGTPNTNIKEYWDDGDINWFTPSDITNGKTMFLSSSTKKITKLGLESSSAKIIPPYSVMMTSRATIGEVSINTIQATTNQGFITLVPNEKISLYQIYFWVIENKNNIISMANGSTFKEISKKDFNNIPIEVNKKVDIFNKEIESYFKQIENLTSEIKVLDNLKEFLIRELI